MGLGWGLDSWLMWAAAVVRFLFLLLLSLSVVK